MLFVLLSSLLLFLLKIKYSHIASSQAELKNHTTTIFHIGKHAHTHTCKNAPTSNTIKSVNYQIIFFLLCVCFRFFFLSFSFFFILFVCLLVPRLVDDLPSTICRSTYSHTHTYIARLETHTQVGGGSTYFETQAKRDVHQQRKSGRETLRERER